MLNVQSNIIKMLHKHKLKKTAQIVFSIASADYRRAGSFYRAYPSFNSGVKFASALPLKEQPCRKRWRGGEEALWRGDKKK